MPPLVSIIMPTYNSASTVSDSINSILSQSYTNWELLITDDCSTDDTLRVISEFATIDSRIQIFQNEINSGAGISRNNSIKESKGRFIAFLDSDDMWTPTKLELQINFMINNNYALTYSHYKKINNAGRVIGHITPPERVNYSQLLKSNVIGCLTAIYDTSILGKIFMPSIRKRQDMALWLKILEKTDYAWCIPCELAIYREGHQSLSSNKLKILFAQWYFYKNYLQFSFLKAAWYFSFYIVSSIRKYGLKKST